MSRLKVLNSEIDGTINHVYDDGSEFRLVRRDDHDTIYLSSHTGCALGCKMCHLTTSGQTQMTPLSAIDIEMRAQKLLYESYKPWKAAKGRINFAFMARGDALMPGSSVDGRLVQRLLAMTWEDKKCHAKVTISTIFPKSFGENIAERLFDRFGPYQPTLYWSLYSTDATFREYWLPQAQEPSLVARELKKWQDATFQDIVIHHALIDHPDPKLNNAWLGNPPGEWSGTGAPSIQALMWLEHLRYRVNIVRYNPATTEQGSEPSEAVYKMNKDAYTLRGVPVKIQSRVGFDVAASCGMFVAKGSYNEQE